MITVLLDEILTMYIDRPVNLKGFVVNIILFSSNVTIFLYIVLVIPLDNCLQKCLIAFMPIVFRNSLFLEKKLSCDEK